MDHYGALKKMGLARYDAITDTRHRKQGRVALEKRVLLFDTEKAPIASVIRDRKHCCLRQKKRACYC